MKKGRRIVISPPERRELNRRVRSRKIRAEGPGANLESVLDANGCTTSLAGDELERLTSKTFPVGTLELFGYDAKGNLVRRTRARVRPYAAQCK